jgi:hypothetical protein
MEGPDGMGEKRRKKKKEVDDGTGQKSGGECGLGKKTQLIEAKEGGGGVVDVWSGTQQEEQGNKLTKGKTGGKMKSGLKNKLENANDVNIG